MINKTVKPCPFCGGTDLYIDGGEYLQDFEVRCVKCGGHIAYFNTRAEAIDAWNRRVHDESTTD